MSPQSTILNDWANFWHYDIGPNVIPADTKNKTTYESWTQWQDQSIPDEVFELRKRKGDYNNGIAIIPGPIWRGPYTGKYLVVIDLDNKKAIEEFCRDENGLELLKQKTLVEQTANPDKMHVYFIVDREIPNKTSDKVDISKAEKIEANEIPALEVKSNSKGIIFCSASPHQKDGNYQIKGTLKPQIFYAQDVEDRIGGICDRYGIPYGFNSRTQFLNQIPIEDLWKTETKILEGHNRHLEIMRIMESLLQNNRKMPLDTIKQMAHLWNQSHCKPPLDDHEFEKQWKCALKFVRRNIVINDNNIGGGSGNSNSNFNDDIITNKSNNNDNNYKDNSSGDVKQQKPKKKEFVTFKYSQLGKRELHEAVIVNGLPFFIKYDHITNTFGLIERIEENSRILRPPSIEEYPYTQYSFESNEELHFFMQKAKQITSLDELYINSKSIFSKYIDQDEYIISLLAADSIWTYFQDLFSATHYGEGVGTNDVGKSSMGYTFEYTGYRVIKGTAISGANYSRVLGSIEPGQCTIIEDEGDNISEDTEKVKILKTGYEYNSKIPKINMNTRYQEQKWYFAFCYKMILAEKSLKEYKARGLVDRTFSFPCRPGKVKYSIKEVVSQNINKSPKLQKLYDELLSFRKLMLCYRLIHYKDLLPEIETRLENRDQELCKPLLQLFYGTEALNKEIIPTLEIFVKQRRTRKGNSLEAALYPIIKKFVFSEVGLDHEINTYLELKQKNKKLIKVPFYRIWDDIKDGGIDGQYDVNKKYQYETVDYGSLYLNSLTTTISNKFAATIKKEDYGKALIFDVDKLERFEDLYSNSHLKGDNVKIEVKLKTEETTITDNNDNSDNYDNFPKEYTNILEKNQDNNNNNNNRLGLNDYNLSNEEKEDSEIVLKTEKNYSEIDKRLFQKLSDSSELSELSSSSITDEQQQEEDEEDHYNG